MVRAGKSEWDMCCSRGKKRKTNTGARETVINCNFVQRRRECETIERKREREITKERDERDERERG